MKKTTMATIKSFIKKNSDDLYVRVKTSYSGWSDCVEVIEDNFEKVSAANAIGHDGIWCVGSSDDKFRNYEDDKYVGYEIYNCCGSGYLVTRK